ncbi:MAG TPA: preprotein translocase subunit SecG [Burkholderiales bacterium]|nr:preprotein translocase subunit SecG [Burkholderiales bacterium]
MEMWTNIVIVAHVLIAVAIIGLVLLQHGKGADMGSGFGGGASGSLFGATGSANFLSRATAVLATVFFLTSLGLAYLATNRPKAGGGALDATKAQQSVPAKDIAPKAPEKAAVEKPAAESPVPAPKAPAEGSKAKDVPQ